MNENLVARVENLSVAFGPSASASPVVRDVSFEVLRGQTLAIVGESGSGKSVTSMAMMGLIRRAGGRIVSGSMHLQTRGNEVIDLVTAPESVMRQHRGSSMSMIFQEPMTSLNPVFKISSQLIETIVLHRHCNRSEAEAQALRMLDLVRIPDAKQIMNRYPHELSGGMRQRIMIAMSLVCEPTLLIADEPTTALDVTVQAQILRIIKELQGSLAMGVIFITHDMGVVAEVADQVMVMKKGETVEHGPARAVLQAPRQAYTRALLAAVPRIGAMNGTQLPAKFPLIDDQAGARPSASEPTRDIAPDYESPPLLSVKSLSIRYDLKGGLLGKVRRRVHAVEAIDFDIYAGETLALVGESGCGKSTSARAIAGLMPIQGGDIVFGGKHLASLNSNGLKTLRRDIQMVFQDPYASLNPRLTIEKSLLEPLHVHGIARGAEARRQVRNLLERVGLPAEYAERYPHEFSGGQRQRICIARALTLSPKLIIADEAVSALDVSIQAQVINLLQDLQRDMGISFLFISHDLAVVERVSHRVGVMYHGRIVEIGPRRSVFENPHHAYTQRLLSAVPSADLDVPRKPFNLMEETVPSRIYAVDYQAPGMDYREVAPGHFVASSALM
ncbi:ABC transporter ATP-binding protein [Pseudomonas gingeri]|uniref:Glutathione import ATP-binding protein GsiA n=1 Tax=Pseudomonas gingeri TaxID=117681 RepID=A0A7Y7YI46_9PSED|nr:dipeptide ABC transporter ATP-binding protein [Pseudomonas gingeri]NWA02632.1 dipeptide ABC transporter ATP-binding protein [Pseudomonas gingeri]NWA12195.1 dipeptide ABC transporter ATP-binding protein [Pseudomonas gingeri]NWA57399.1 dipeptide ABC transporter ATP-binding protein [Pseudomonas gingeri]NWA93742.1 dipeptide ABC transporter ATP-binding protein [Pseudomonas gingeri]NWB03214.1 dipeptide ABC transporter ATP-binding protein [Pseudomonas gingeri]